MSGEAAECRWMQEHPKIEARLNEHDRRIEKLEKEATEDRRELWRSLGRLENTVAQMRGWLAGSMLAATLVGGILSFIAAKVFH